MRNTLKRFYILLGLTMIVLFVVAAPKVWSQPASLMVQGNQVVNSLGCTVHLNGVDVDGLEFVSSSTSGSWPGTLQGVAQMAVTGWHSTIIRLPLSQDFWFGCGGSNENTYQGIVQSIVNYCSGQGVYVLLDLHWSGESSTATAPCGTGWGSDHTTAQQPMADANAVTFWASVATAYANNPAVLFDLYNEPYDLGNDNPGGIDTSGYAVWLKGGTLGNATFTTPGMQVLLNAVRATGANNICLMGGLHWCANLNGLPASSITNFGNGVMFAAHIYGANDGFDSGSWDGEVPNSILSNYPVFVGEYGPDGSSNEQTQSADASSFDKPFFTWLTSTSGILGSTAWSFTINSWPNLYTDSPANFSPTTVWGVDVKNFLGTPEPSYCPPTPTFSPTACTDGAGHTCTPTFTPTITNTPTPTATPTVTLSPTVTTTPGIVNLPWPNPWPDKGNPNAPLQFNYNNSQQEEQVSLKIYTVAFRKVFEDDGLNTAAGSYTYSLDWTKIRSMISNGLYYFVVDTRNGSSHNQQVMKVLILR